jgi:protein-L-isoaspartate(D-aspartate) O-methyltransferase
MTFKSKNKTSSFIFVIGATSTLLLLNGCGLRADKSLGDGDEARKIAESSQQQKKNKMTNEQEQLVGKRKEMVTRQLAGRDITSPDVLNAMEAVPRHEFVPTSKRSQAYEDYPLPIGYNQTISQPYIVAFMTQALGPKKGDKILEIGTGSGYQAAVLAKMGAQVHSIEIVEPLGLEAKKLLKRLNYKVNVVIGDGYDGIPSQAPFDGIMVTAAPPQIPKPLIEQLKEGGTLVIPVGSLNQTLKIYTKKDNELILKRTLPVRFVPMTGKAQK